MKASCINSMLRFLTLTSNEEGSRFWYKNHTVSLEKYWFTFVKPEKYWFAFVKPDEYWLTFVKPLHVPKRRRSYD